jgi:benzoylformate decarboxylase
MMSITDHISKNNIVIEEALVSSRNLLKFLPFKNNKDFYGLASGGIGWAISGSIGVSLANPTKTIIAIIGDGSSMYAIQSIWTAAHYNLPIIYVIANNEGYRIIKERLESFHKNTTFIGMDFNKPKIDFVKIANAMGVESTKVSKPQDLKSLFKQTFKYKKPYLIEVLLEKGY